MAARKPKARARAAAAQPASGQPIHNGSLAARAYDDIKERILSLYFLPGQYLNEGAICALLGVGRTPVHQALHRLAAEGLVEIMPRKGVIVLPDSIGEIIKILDSRITVEAELARNAAEHATAAEAEELKGLAHAIDPDGPAPAIDAFIAADRAFHRRLAELSGNPVLADFARRLHERSSRFWTLHLWQTMDVRANDRQHGAIAEAVKRRDGDAAADAMRRHIAALKTRLMNIQGRTQQPSPEPTRRSK
jgi:GntR family transcriptional regulator, rspAB operon transcriptional repressor